jgi:hypothetical protein
VKAQLLCLQPQVGAKCDMEPDALAAAIGGGVALRHTTVGRILYAIVLIVTAGLAWVIVFWHVCRNEDTAKSIASAVANRFAPRPAVESEQIGQPPSEQDVEDDDVPATTFEEGDDDELQQQEESVQQPQSQQQNIAAATSQWAQNVATAAQSAPSAGPMANPVSAVGQPQQSQQAANQSGSQGQQNPSAVTSQGTQNAAAQSAPSAEPMANPGPAVGQPQQQQQTANALKPDATAQKPPKWDGIRPHELANLGRDEYLERLIDLYEENTLIDPTEEGQDAPQSIEQATDFGWYFDCKFDGPTILGRLIAGILFLARHEQTKQSNGLKLMLCGLMDAYKYPKLRESIMNCISDKYICRAVAISTLDALYGNEIPGRIFGAGFISLGVIRWMRDVDPAAAFNALYGDAASVVFFPSDGELAGYDGLHEFMVRSSYSRFFMLAWKFVFGIDVECTADKLEKSSNVLFFSGCFGIESRSMWGACVVSRNLMEIYDRFNSLNTRIGAMLKFPIPYCNLHSNLTAATETSSDIDCDGNWRTHTAREPGGETLEEILGDIENAIWAVCGEKFSEAPRAVAADVAVPGRESVGEADWRAKLAADGDSIAADWFSGDRAKAAGPEKSLDGHSQTYEVKDWLLADSRLASIVAKRAKNNGYRLAAFSDMENGCIIDFILKKIEYLRIVFRHCGGRIPPVPVEKVVAKMFSDYIEIKDRLHSDSIKFDGGNDLQSLFDAAIQIAFKKPEGCHDGSFPFMPACDGWEPYEISIPKEIFSKMKHASDLGEIKRAVLSSGGIHVMCGGERYRISGADGKLIVVNGDGEPVEQTNPIYERLKNKATIIRMQLDNG